ncbi:hypothetical protein KIN20_002058 [Parelaphostrongylus tenuis]|uniref:Uncharacterized protein n=1 Tax=Parelaphostrongylus tenuis TaxID=148309 RepID=A0AAD5QCR8_PARTN|nr:hypothetical protein KIN20_002058 [Parelaphostrongylus tenuis]
MDRTDKGGYAAMSITATQAWRPRILQRTDNISTSKDRGTTPWPGVVVMLSRGERRAVTYPNSSRQCNKQRLMETPTNRLRTEIARKLACEPAFADVSTRRRNEIGESNVKVLGFARDEKKTL